TGVQTCALRICERGSRTRLSLSTWGCPVLRSGTSGGVWGHGQSTASGAITTIDRVSLPALCSGGGVARQTTHDTPDHRVTPAFQGGTVWGGGGWQGAHALPRGASR